MAEVNSIFGDVRGKVGNIILYKGRGDKTLCRGSWPTRKASNETQKRQATVFGTLAKMKQRLKPVIDIGFPGNGKDLKGCNAFVSANWTDVISVKKINPSKKVSKRKSAPQEFRGKIDFQKLRVAAGPLFPPAVEVTIDEEQNKAQVSHQATTVHTVDCFLDDQIHIALVDKEKLYCHILKICQRAESGEFIVPIPKRMDARNLVVYTFATNANGLYASNSVCLRMPS